MGIPHMNLDPGAATLRGSFLGRADRAIREAMVSFATKPLPEAYDVLAPDGSEVRVLLALAGGSMAHFSLPAGKVSRAVRHGTVEEIWFVLGGRGQMWRAQAGREEVSDLAPGDCLTIPVGTAFQFRAAGDAAFTAVAITMPPWPGSEEAEFVPGAWAATA
jgi:mannose-6-phosphate isomerase-like protein (cupin superfamily)